MKKKIFGFIIGLLLITPAIPTVGSLRQRVIAPIPSSWSNQRYPSINWAEVQKLIPHDGEIEEEFGVSISLDGDTALIGATGDNDNGYMSGAVYIYQHLGTTWTFQVKLLASDGAPYDRFGCSVSLSGNTALIGASEDDEQTGSAYVFTRNGTTWTQQVKLLASDGMSNDHFGRSVSLSGDTALIGAPYKDNGSGSAYVFIRIGSTWTLQAHLLPIEAYTGYGFSVSLQDNIALIGSCWAGNGSGSAFVLTRSGSTWTQQAQLLASDGHIYDMFGCCVSLSGDTALIGACYHNSYRGAAYVFTCTGINWTQQAELLASDGWLGDWFGDAVSLSGDTAFIGAWPDDEATGSVYVFTRVDTTWVQQAKLLASDHSTGEYFGRGISLSNDVALIGKYGDNCNRGAVYVFINNEPPHAQFFWMPQQPMTFQTIIFNASGSTDNDGTIALYEWDWNNDGQYDEAYTIPIAAHSWQDTGNYTVTLKVTDDDGVNGTTKEIVTINEVPINVTIKGGLGVKVLIMNNEITNATDIPWQVHIDGGILGFIDITLNGTVDIPSEGSKTVETGIFFGFGPITIKVQVADKELKVTGIQLTIFSIVKKQRTVFF